MQTKRQKSPIITREIAEKIKLLYKNTDLNYAQIAAQLGALNQGRVSEVITGKRFQDVQASEGL